MKWLVSVALVWCAGVCAQGMPPAPVEVVEARSYEFAPQLKLPGEVVSQSDSLLASAVGARVAWIAEVGDRIGAGDEVARLDAREFELELRGAEAELRRLRAQRELAARQLNRLDALAEKNVLAERELDEAQVALEVLKEEIAAASVRRDEAQRRLDLASIRAPFDGVVVSRNTQVGEHAAIGSPIARLVDASHVEVRARGPVSLSEGLLPGDIVRVQAEGKEVDGTLRAVVPVADPVSRTIEMRVSLPEGALPIGAAVDVALSTGDSAWALAAPRDVLVLRNERAYVFRITAEDKAERIQVQTGREQDGMVQLIGDISDGDRIVIRGAERLAPGQSVRVLVSEGESQPS